MPPPTNIDAQVAAAVAAAITAEDIKVAARFTTAEARLAALERRVTALEPKPVPVPAPAPPPPPVPVPPPAPAPVGVVTVTGQTPGLNACTVAVAAFPGAKDYRVCPAVNDTWCVYGGGALTLPVPGLPAGGLDVMVEALDAPGPAVGLVNGAPPALPRVIARSAVCHLSAAPPLPPPPAPTPTPAPPTPPPAPTPTPAPPTPPPAPTPTPPPAPNPMPMPPPAPAPPFPTGGAASPGGAALPVPDMLVAESDDHNAVIQWHVPGTQNGAGPLDPATRGLQPGRRSGPLRPDEGEPAALLGGGFAVTWGPAASPAAHWALTMERIFQCQPLDPGVTYQAVVQCVDGLGNLGPASPPVTFRHDPARVDALRAQMTAFFEDFNRPAGVFDELRWNTTYGANNDPLFNGSFVNAQSHAHNMLSNWGGHYIDRLWVIDRPRAVFDFTGRTGVITWDMDGEFFRDQYYLDLIPESLNGGRTDAVGHINIEDATLCHPGDYLRVKQNNQTVYLFYFDATGKETVICSSDFSSPKYGELDWYGLKLVANVRRHFRLEVSVTHVRLLLDGFEVAAGDFPAPLSYSRVVPLWFPFSYNTIKANEPTMLLHWDNFGFDGPAPATVTHNYKASLDGTDYARLQNFVPVSETLSIPDVIAGATARRLMFTMQTRGLYYQWDARDRVTVNGHDIPVPQPASATGLTGGALVSDYTPFPVVLDVPEGVFVTGANTVTFTMSCSGAANLHAEFDFPAGAAPFPAGSAPAYTQPQAVLDPSRAGADAMPAMLTMGPSYIVDSIAGQKYAEYGYPPVGAPTVSQSRDYGAGVGRVPVALSVKCGVQQSANGQVQGIDRVRVDLNGAPVFAQGCAAAVPAPTAEITVTLDIRALTPGAHAFTVHAFAPNGDEGTPMMESALSARRLAEIAGTPWSFPFGLTVVA